MTPISTDQTASGVLSQVPLSLNSVLEQNRHLPAAEVDGQMVVLSLEAGAYFDFNRSATEIWRAFATPRKVDEIVRNLSRHYDLGPEKIGPDVLEFLQQLVDQRLLRVFGTASDEGQEHSTRLSS